MVSLLKYLASKFHIIVYPSVYLSKVMVVSCFQFESGVGCSSTLGRNVLIFHSEGIVVWSHLSASEALQSSEVALRWSDWSQFSVEPFLLE